MVFIITIASSTYLWEMFHGLGFNIGCSLLIGNVFMLITELDLVREDRDLCCAIGALMAFFYTIVGTLLALKTFAIFSAVVYGVIGGRIRVYLTLGK